MSFLKRKSFNFAIAVAILSSDLLLGVDCKRYDVFQNQLVELNSQKNSAEAERFDELCRLYWEFLMSESPEYATIVGWPGEHGEWTDLSLEAYKHQLQVIDQISQTLLSLDPLLLPLEDQLSYTLLKRDLSDWKEELDFGSHYLCVNQMWGVHLDIEQTIAVMPTKTAAHYRDILSRLNGIPKVIDQVIVLLSEGVKLGITPPQITLRDVPLQIESQITPNPTESAFFQPFHSFPQEISLLDQKEFSEEGSRVINDQVFPAFRKLHKYLTECYVPAARSTTALSDLPRGKEYYAFRVRNQTTTELTPQQIHEIGLVEVKRISDEMQNVIQGIGFKGDSSEFISLLNTAPHFYYNNKEDLLQGYRDLIKHVNERLPGLFGKLPKLPCEVAPIPPSSEKSQAGAYYLMGSSQTGRPGCFYVNTYNISSRPSWEMESLALHEALPGHHLQLSLAQEIGDMPEFRRHVKYNAFVEGWALYSEGLGAELGLYQNPYSFFGRLSNEMMRAVRLVVDTGMHALGWSRQEGIDYFKKHVPISEHQIIAEIDRYLVMPAQALSYKIGELKIKELRKSSEEALGPRFDIRKFHDALLSNGTVPLDVLEDQVRDRI